jgi:hypothetical protein
VILALDLEGTLVSNAVSVFARPGLRAFLGWAGQAFDAVVLFTSVSSARARAVAAVLAGAGSAPEWFADVAVVAWPHKDLSFVGDPRVVLLVDDQAAYVTSDQCDRWVPVRPWAAPYPDDDRELARLRAELERRPAAGPRPLRH